MTTTTQVYYKQITVHKLQGHGWRKRGEIFNALSTTKWWHYLV